MSPKPTGHVRGSDLILTRTFRAPIDDVWTSVTKSENTALWFGSWEGDAGPGKIVRLQLVHEKGQPWTNVMIEECKAPRRHRAALGAAPERPETRGRRRAWLGVLPRHAGRRA